MCMLVMNLHWGNCVGRTVLSISKVSGISGEVAAGEVEPANCFGPCSDILIYNNRAR